MTTSFRPQVAAAFEVLAEGLAPFVDARMSALHPDEDWILMAAAKLVAGYQPIMPTYQGLVSEEGVMQLVAYIQSLGGPAAPSAGVPGGAAVAAPPVTGREGTR